jgi:hypothetical protein
MPAHEGILLTDGGGHDFTTFSVRSVDPKLHLLQADIAPIMTVLQNLSRGPRAKQVKEEWNEIALLPHTDIVATGGDTDVATVLKVTDANLYKIGDFLKYQKTGELAGRVTAKDTGASPNTVTVAARGVIGTNLSNTAGDPIIIIRGHLQEGGDAAGSLVEQPTNKFNYIQPKSTTWEVSDILEDSETYADINKIKTLRALKMKDHMEDWEKDLIYGVKGKFTTQGTRYFMGGLLEFLTTTVETVTVGSGGTKQFTQKQWETWIKRLFKYNQSSRRKMVFASGDVLQQVSEYKYHALDMRPGDPMIDVSAFAYRSNFGRVDMVHERFLSSEFNTDWYAMGLDLNNIFWMPYQRQIVKENIQNRNQHKRIDEIYESGTIKVINEQTSGVFRVIE